MRTTQERYMLFWTNPGSSTQQNSSCMATCTSFHKPPNQDILEKYGKFISKNLWIPTYQYWLSSNIQQLCADTEYSLEDLPQIMYDREREDSMLSAQFHDYDMYGCNV